MKLRFSIAGVLLLTTLVAVVVSFSVYWYRSSFRVAEMRAKVRLLYETATAKEQQIKLPHPQDGPICELGPPHEYDFVPKNLLPTR